MSQDCLLLNGNGRPISYLPLSVITWKTAIKLTITRNVIVIKEHKDWVVRSPSVEMKVPSILMLQSYHPFHSYVKFSRSNVFLRELYTCQYCFDIFMVFYHDQRRKCYLYTKSNMCFKFFILVHFDTFNVNKSIQRKRFRKYMTKVVSIELNLISTESKENYYCNL